MATLTATSLSPTEQRTLDRLVASLESELRDDLLAVWLFGSRARGEPPGDDSDVDLMVITRTGEDPERVQELRKEAAGSEGLDLFRISTLVRDPAWIAERRAVDSFLLQEVDRDRIVLYGSDGGEFGERVPFRRRGDGRVSERTDEYLRDAREGVAAAQALLEAEVHNRAISQAYYAMFLAARAALSEEDRFARTHDGTWHLHHDVFVKTGRFPADLHAGARETEKRRYYVDYESGRYTFDQGRETVELAERFLAATVEQLSAS
ncbi:MAG TPA: HEPN domain-containing protein [Thermoleophilaceae bacterium]|nr:HEPN domain-containing protein [Thermoleophilaceae bacterium]